VAPLVISVLSFLGFARRARTGRVGAFEERTFRTVNRLPASLNAPVWVVMQAGNLAAVPAVAVIVGRRRRSAGIGAAVAGSSVWALSKVIKRRVGRGRPADHLTGVIVRGRGQSGLGFPSGHAAVAVALAVTAGRVASPTGRRLAWVTAAAVGGARQYVGAHLPLDVAGGVALGAAAGALTNLVSDRYSTT
jgi:undecaprenyl-diphosphatase